jgi:hypothetical protein
MELDDETSRKLTKLYEEMGAQALKIIADLDLVDRVSKVEIEVTLFPEPVPIETVVPICGPESTGRNLYLVGSPPQGEKN